MKESRYCAMMVAVAMLVLTSCTQNEGYIGDLFGQWRLHEITCGDEVEQCDTMFLAFQADIFQLRRVYYESYDYVTFTGLYTRTDSTMCCNFLNYNSVDVSTSDSLMQAMLRDLATLHITEPQPTFGIVTLTRSDMLLEYNGYRYAFEKL